METSQTLASLVRGSADLIQSIDSFKRKYSVILRLNEFFYTNNVILLFQPQYIVENIRHKR